jgi:hypothetical protein
MFDQAPDKMVKKEHTLKLSFTDKTRKGYRK